MQLVYGSANDPPFAFCANPITKDYRPPIGFVKLEAPSCPEFQTRTFPEQDREVSPSLRHEARWVARAITFITLLTLISIVLAKAGDFVEQLAGFAVKCRSAAEEVWTKKPSTSEKAVAASVDARQAPGPREK
jgi:hypothetical protein